ncbi:MAG: hypothetical protein HFP81_08490 [Methylococcales symbiont of Hymedesmia sp. n. MRB-2018]|nr:MAG: hypothetical protein HFP78_08715 [Methylococcales symbiont of Hymedesmia sp. n. MRB-2018]KAF3983211.1 MAG: hypothetical protein HFP81_08490 [Methylococcales symbiont of Hymedesmia sp. n. MRB-2018]
MSEIIFILIILYIAYVIKTSCNENKETGLSFLGSKEEVSETKESIEVVKKEQPAPKKIKPVADKVMPLSDGKKIPSGNLRNPETGEEAKMANSYRMSKRWIKDALVAEGLLDKVYKPAEVDEAKKIEINLAFEKLLQMDKYK